MLLKCTPEELKLITTEELKLIYVAIVDALELNVDNVSEASLDFTLLENMISVG